MILEVTYIVCLIIEYVNLETFYLKNDNVENVKQITQLYRMKFNDIEIYISSDILLSIILIIEQL